MPLYWTYRSLPEVATLSPKEQRRLLYNCWWKPFTLLKVWCYLVVFTAFWFALLVGISFLSRGLNTKIPPSIIALAISIIVTLPFVLSLNTSYLHHLRPYLRAQLGNLCSNCGFDLRASTTRCPECGTLLPPNPS